MGGKYSRNRNSRVTRLVPFIDVEVHINLEDKCSISGITSIDTGRIVVSDYLGKYVKYYDTKDLQMVDYLALTTPPYEVCSSAVDSSEVFVTLPFRNKILHLRIDEKINVVKEIQAEGMCYGIASFKGGLAVSLKLDKHVWQIEILNFDGSVQKVFKDDDNGRELFGFPDYIAMETDGSRLYVSDGMFNTVTAYDLKSSTMISISPIFTYTDRSLSIPKGITLDESGNVYIVACESSNVHKISRTGKKLGVVLDRKNELSMPMGCCYDVKENKFFITEGSRKIMVLKVENNS